MIHTLLTNEHVKVTHYEDDKSIVFADLTDKYNETTGYTRKKRGVEKTAAFILHLSEGELAEDITFSDVVKILERANLAPRIYCAMD